MKNPMLKFIMKGKKQDMVHTSVYANAQNDGKFGTASTRSFDDRIRVKNNRHRIREYNDSRIVTEAYASSGVRAKTYEAPKGNDTFLNKNKRDNSATSIKPAVTNANTSSRPPATRNAGISKKI